MLHWSRYDLKHRTEGFFPWTQFDVLDQDVVATEFVVYILHELVNDNGRQIGDVQQLFTTHTELFDVHCLAVLQGSNNEQTTCGPQNDRFIDVSNR